MTVIELVSKCCNAGYGKIRVVNHNNLEDNQIFNSITELAEISNIANREVFNWEFCPQKQLNTIGWVFVLEVTV